MRLEDLYPNFSTALPEVQQHIVARYRQQRVEDMAKPSTFRVPKTKKKKVKVKAPPLSTEEKLIMKTLGLTKKQVIAMRGVS